MPVAEAEPATLVAAVYDDADEGRQAADELLAAGLPRERIRRCTLESDEPTLDGAGLPAYAVERYRETLRRGRTIVVARAETDRASEVDAMLRQHRPLETSIHPYEADGSTDDILPASASSTAALSGRPRGHRDPSA